jgi:hypothetical integral membrane protein (TIGR02206 family)
VVRSALAALLLINFLAYYASFAAAGQPLFPGHLPLELCDISVLVVIAALLMRSPAVFDVAYYWALAGAGNALFTPNFTQASWFLWVQYFVSHGLIVAATLYLAWSGQARPRPGSVGRVFLLTNGYAVLAGGFDYFFGTNYMYLRHKPPAPTLLDGLGPWPWYIAACEGLALGLFALLYLPFRRAALPAPASAEEPTQSFQ